jgi:heptose-I-phosphate ethanolaminephosphotransferase
MFKSAKFKYCFIFLLCLLPWICFALLLNYWNYKLLLAYLLSALIICGIYYVLPNVLSKKIWWLVGGFILLAWSLTETLNVLQEKVIINDLAMKIFFESNPRELKEYFLGVVSLWGLIIATVLIIALIIFFLKFKHQASNAKYQKPALAIIALSMCTLLALGGSYRYGIFTNIQSSAVKLIAYYRSITKSPETIAAELKSLQASHTAAKKTYVLIIGESTSRHHMSMYGYGRQTTPLLAARKDLQFFTDVISSNTSTVECLGKYLTINANQDSIRNFGDVNILDVAHSCGIKTFWLSNQNKDGIYENSITLGTRNAQYHYFLQDVHVASTTRYDDLLLPTLQKVLADTASEKLICLHLMGTHFKFNDRYPASFNKFTGTEDLKKLTPFANTPSKIERVNNYDNANLHQDYFLNNVFNILDAYKNNGADISAIYFSDHGEEVFDYRDFVGHNPQSNSAWLHEVPFMLWNFPENKHKNKPYQLSYFNNTFMQWLNINVSTIVPSASILSDSVNIGKRYMGNGQLYIKQK